MRHTLALSAAMLALAFAAFAPALPGPFDFDDGPAIVTNTTIRPEATTADLLRTPPLGTAVSGRPLVNASFAANGAANRALGIAEPDGLTGTGAAAGFRATNIILHVLAALLLFAIVDTLLAHGLVPVALQSRHLATAVVVAMLWLVHPLQTEAVNYVSQRTEVLASLFYLAAVFFAVRCLLAVDERIDASPARSGVAAMLAVLLGAASKEIIVTVPIVVAALDVGLLGTSWASLFKSPSRRRLYVASSRARFYRRCRTFSARAPAPSAPLAGSHRSTIS